MAEVCCSFFFFFIYIYIPTPVCPAEVKYMRAFNRGLAFHHFQQSTKRCTHFSMQVTSFYPGVDLCAYKYINTHCISLFQCYVYIKTFVDPSRFFSHGVVVLSLLKILHI